MQLYSVFDDARFEKFADQNQGYRPESSRVADPIDHRLHKLLSIRPPVMTPTGAASRHTGLMLRDEGVTRRPRGDQE